MATNRERMLASAAPKPPPTLEDDGTRGHVNGSKSPTGINVDPSDPLGSVGSILGAPLSGLGGIADAVSRATAWVSNPRNWVRVIEVIGGAILIIIALSIMTASAAAPAVAPVVKAVGKVV